MVMDGSTSARPSGRSPRLLSNHREHLTVSCGELATRHQRFHNLRGTPVMDNGDGGEFFLDQSDSTSHVPSPLPGGADNAWGKGASAPSFVDHPWRGDANRHHRCGDAASRSWRSSSLSANNSALRRAALAVKLAAGNRERRMQQMIMLSGPAQRFRPITLREHVRTLHAEG